MQWTDYTRDFLAHVFVPGFCQRLPLLLACVLMMLIVSGRLGQGLGVPLLVWHENGWKRFFSGFAVTLFFQNVFLVGFLLETDIADPPAKPGGGGGWFHPFDHYWVPSPLEKWQLLGWLGLQPVLRELCGYLAAMTCLLLVGFGLLGLWHLSRRVLLRLRAQPDRESYVEALPEERTILWRWPPAFLLGVAAALALLALLVWATSFYLRSSPARWMGEQIRTFAEKLEHPGPAEADAGMPAQAGAGRGAAILAKVTPTKDEQAREDERELHAGAAALGLLLLVSLFLFRLDTSGAYVTPILSVCSLLAFAASVYGFVVFWVFESPLLADVPWPLVVLLLLLLLLLLGGASRYKFRFAALKDLYQQPVRLDTYNPDGHGTTLIVAGGVGDGEGKRDVVVQREQENPADLVRKEKAQWAAPAEGQPVRAAPPPDRPLVVVCVSGGASRSAVWTAAILQELDRQIPGFSHMVYLLAGASGGMVGAAYHVAMLQPPQGWPWPKGTRRCSFGVSPTEMVDRLAADSLSPVIHGMVFGDLPALFSPFALATNRGEGLEAAWEHRLEKALDKSFEELAEGEVAGWRPSLVFTPMLVEDGRRLLISNLDLKPLAASLWNALGSGQGYGTSRPALELFKLFPAARKTFPLSTAARMNASFPYVSPAAALPTRPRRRVVDAGYYDNYGINLAAAWLYLHRYWLKNHVPRVLPVHIRDGRSAADRNRPDRPWDRSGGLSRGLEEFASPLDAVLAARDAAMSFRNDQQLEILSHTFNQDVGPDFFTAVLFENPAHVSMSWYVSAGEKKKMQNAVRSRTIQDQIAALATLF
jgi:hypothetical protein